MHKNATKVLIGTITANFNNGKYIKDCLNGLLKQTKPIDFITIIDDASTDNSRELIRQEVETKFAIKKEASDHYIADSNGTTIIVFHRKQNGGPAAARNDGVRLLKDRTNFICIADADDILYPKKIEKSLEIALKYPNIGLVYSDYDTLNIATGQSTREYKEIFTYQRLIEECIVSNNSFLATNIFNLIGLYDESLFGPEDYDLWLRISEVAAIYHIPESLYQYRMTGNNITVTTPNQHFAEHVARVKQKASERRNAKKQTN
jgi:glycosyltransferase involved in cell wall biosynthesis